MGYIAGKEGIPRNMSGEEGEHHEDTPITEIVKGGDDIRKDEEGRVVRNFGNKNEFKKRREIIERLIKKEHIRNTKYEDQNILAKLAKYEVENRHKKGDQNEK
jgi:hypothetical protein